ncbi:hypothetical protein AAK706_05720 [Erysipelotrichaceae bacterium 66-17]
MQKKRSGIPLSEIFRSYGIDPCILGSSRVEGFSYTLNKKAGKKKLLRNDQIQDINVLQKLEKNLCCSRSSSWSMNWLIPARKWSF